MEEHLKSKKDCAQKAFVRGAEHLKSKKIKRKSFRINKGNRARPES